jgi:hypothetical protein
MTKRYNPTTVTEFDRVIGGGIVPGSTILLGGSYRWRQGSHSRSMASTTVRDTREGS